jgi:C-terminal peptidase (prc)
LRKEIKLLAVLWFCSLIVVSTGTYFGLHGYEKKRNGTGEDMAPLQQAQKDLEKVARAYELIRNGYVEKVEEKALIEGAIEGMISKLGDPYSAYMNQTMSRQLNETLDSAFEGIGAEISEIDGKIVIIAPFKNSPAEKAGLKPNDQILTVDGIEVGGRRVYEVTSMIRGKKGTEVTLEIVREGMDHPLKITVVRDRIPIQTVTSKLIDRGGKRIGSIEISSFSRDTGKDFSAHLRKLEEKRMDGLILDVRGNPGGLLGSVEEIARHFVEAGKPILQIVQRNGEKEEVLSDNKGTKPYPIVVLIDKGSASASEILAAALSEAEGIPLIGEKTFGKGTVQQQIDLGDGTQLKLTTYKWLTPKGNWIHGKGIAPDIKVTQPELFRLHPVIVEKPLKRDMNGEQVRQAQLVLKSLGFEPGRTDGYFDASTEKAVKHFQQVNGLSATGLIDRDTARRMEQIVKKELENPENDRQMQMALRYFEYQKRGEK